MWNDKETDLDLLGYDKIAEIILEIVKDQHLRPLTVGVYGDWGAGKSSILSLLNKKVTELPHSDARKIHTIYFNGWLFQGYEDAKSALMETIVTDLAKLQPNLVKVKKLTLSLLKRINWLKVAKVSAGGIMTAVTGIPHPALLGGAVDFLKEAKERFAPDEEDDTTKIEVEKDDPWLKEAEDNVPSQIQAFRKEFKNLIEASKIDQLIILVDDLDRCLPRSVIDILEAIRLFLFVEGTVFVISADERMIEYSVREHFPNLPTGYGDYTKNYLEKLIQIPIRIPTLNKLQTGNYIKFLMLQNYLKNDLATLQKIYRHYESKKSAPYLNIELDFQIVNEALGTSSPELRETLQVGDLLYPTLSEGLKGNLRNIKRFLNTLFLRLKVAKIYGLERVISMEVLAKLMLLERFQSNTFNQLVEDIASSTNGTSQKIKDAEKGSIIDTDDPYLKWNLLMPKLADLDLRPYVFISKEKAIAFSEESSLTPKLIVILTNLSSDATLLLTKAEKELKSISPQEAGLLFKELEKTAQKEPDWHNQPKWVKGLFRIVKAFPEFEIPLMDLFLSMSPEKFGAWVISENSKLVTPDGKDKFGQLLDRLIQNGQTIVKRLAQQTKDRGI
jgi:predicted KAP-like P-loop ATPase